MNNHMRTPTLLLILTLLAPVLSFADATPVVAKTPLYKCEIDVKNGTTTCANQVSVSGLSSGRMVGSVKLCTLIDRNQLTEAEFLVKMAPKARGWLFNVGDSSTNNGWAGDWGTGTPTQPWKQGTPSTGQSRDAEVHINGNLAGTSYSWSVWGSDHTQNALDGHRRLFSEGGMDFSGKTLRVLARNEAVEFGLVGDTSFDRIVNSPYLFALNNQPDFQGPVNCDLYFSSNQVIDGPYRNGSGVENVSITLYGQPPSTIQSTVSMTIEDVLTELSLINSSVTRIPKSIAFKLSPQNSKRLSNILWSKGVDPTTVNESIFGTSERSKQMALETLRAQGLITTSNPTESSLRKALRRFQKRVKVSVPNVNTPEILAELLSAEKMGDLK